MQKRELSKSIECFIPEASLEGVEVNEKFNERSSEADRPTFYTSLLQVGSPSCSNGDFEADKDSNSCAVDKSNYASPIAMERTSTTVKRQASIQRQDISHANVNELSEVNLSFACCSHCDDLKQEIKPHSRPFLVATWYRTPNSPLSTFSAFQDVIDMIDAENLEFYLLVLSLLSIVIY